MAMDSQLIGFPKIQKKQASAKIQNHHQDEWNYKIGHFDLGMPKKFGMSLFAMAVANEYCVRFSCCFKTVKSSIGCLNIVYLNMIH